MIDEQHPLLLGSTSPRRREILRTLRIPAVVVGGAADEAHRLGEGPDRYLNRVVLEKLASVKKAAEQMTVGGVLVADTVVVVDEDVLGKPCDEQEAEAMLIRLSGRRHEVWTRFALATADEPGIAVHQQTVRSGVRFRELSRGEVLAYAASGEGLDKAGAYAVQGLGSFAVMAIDGSYANVVGLPACEVVVALKTTGLVLRFPL